MKKSALVVPPSMQVQLSRLFGAESRIASADKRTDSEWRRDLRLVLAELWNYLDANVETDIVHRLMLDSGFAAAEAGLESDDFWPAYCEGITRIMLCLLGDYPDHRKRKGSGKKKDHYDLNQDRSIAFAQSRKQKMHMLFWTASGLLDLEGKPSSALHEFRKELGFDLPATEFVNWYKQKYPSDYLKMF